MTKMQERARAFWSILKMMERLLGDLDSSKSEDLQKDVKDLKEKGKEIDMASNGLDLMNKLLDDALKLVNILLDASLASREKRKRYTDMIEKLFQFSDVRRQTAPQMPWQDKAVLKEKNRAIHVLWMNEIIRQRELEIEKEEKEKKLEDIMNYRVVAINDIKKTRTRQFTRAQENQAEKRHLKMISDLQFAIDDFNRERKRLSSSRV